MDNNKEYFAFISYKREDEKWAVWLQNKLEHYKLPSNMNGRTDLPKEIRPIFRDKTDLTGGFLSANIQNALEASKYLIVICSPRAAQSQWVGKEVKSFIDMGRTDKIIPFIIGGTAHAQSPEDECFPSALLNLPPEQELLGINIDEMGRDAAAVKVVAQMFGLKFDTLWQRYEREKKWKRNKLFIVGIIAFIVMMGIVFWMYKQRWKMMENRSRFVAEKASRLIDEGDSYLPRILGVSILPNSVSSILKNRPYTAEAEFLLRKAFTNEETIIDPLYFPYYLEFAPNEEALLVLCEDSNNELNYVCIIDTYTGICVQKFLIPSGYSVNAAFNSEGSQIIVSCLIEDENLNPQFYCINTWERINQKYICIDTLLLSPEESITDIEVVKYGKHKNELITASYSGITKSYSYNNGSWSCVDTIFKCNSNIETISLSIDGNVIASGNRDSTMMIWREMDSIWACTDTIKNAFSDAVSISPQGTWVVSANDTIIMCMSLSKAGPICIDTIKLQDYVTSVSFSSDGSQFVSSGRDSTRIWEHKDECWRCVRSFSDNDFSVSEVVYGSSDDKIAWRLSNGKIKVVSMLDNNVCPRCKIERFPGDVHYSKFFDNDKIFAGGYFGLFRIYEYNGLYWEIKSYGEDDERLDWCKSASISNGWLVISWFSNHKIHIYKCDNNEWSLYAINSGYAASISSEGNTMAIAQHDKIEMWHLISNEWVLTDSLIGHNSQYIGGVEALDFSKDGNYLISASHDYSIRIWQKNNKQWLCADTLIFSESHPTNAVFSPNSKQIASSAKNEIIIWDKQKDKWTPTKLSGHTGTINTISYSKDGRYLISTSWDNTIRVWEMAQKKCVYVMDCNNHPQSAFFNEDGCRFIVSFSSEPTKIYDFPPLQDLIDQTRERFKDRPLTPEERHQYYLE